VRRYRARRGSWGQTVTIATKYGILKREPSDGAFRTDLAKKALDLLQSTTKLDTRGPSFEKQAITLKEGGN
jgi:hypothetical protein